MKKYTVIVTRDTTESALVTVEAENKEAAADLALEKARNEWREWERNDFSEGDPYLGDCPENDVQEDEEEQPCRDCGGTQDVSLHTVDGCHDGQGNSIGVPLCGDCQEKRG